MTSPTIESLDGESGDSLGPFDSGGWVWRLGFLGLVEVERLGFESLGLEVENMLEDILHGPSFI